MMPIRRFLTIAMLIAGATICRAADQTPSSNPSEETVTYVWGVPGFLSVWTYQLGGTTLVPVDFFPLATGMKTQWDPKRGVLKIGC